MTDSPLRRLPDFGQSPWLDFIQRGLIESGELARLIERWGLRGVTSNPTIFEQAIAQTGDYDAEIARLAVLRRNAVEIYEALALADVRASADLFLPLYQESNGADGFVSLEVSPLLARDTAGTIAEARRLWAALDRPNAMIKVPGTAAGLDAMRELLLDGVNVNVTLLFSIGRYREVFQTYLDAVEAAAEAGRPVVKIASVASFFLSRIDTAVDAELARASIGGKDVAALRGTAAVASARIAYRAFEEIWAGDRAQRLAQLGARPQRLLWASTGTKDPSYSDTKYVEPLIAPHTVNTLPLATLEAYDNHGRPASRLPGTGAEGARALAALAAVGIDIERVAGDLLEQGIAKFVEPYERLIDSIERRVALCGAQGGG
jgi:transaldolase